MKIPKQPTAIYVAVLSMLLTCLPVYSYEGESKEALMTLSATAAHGGSGSSHIQELNTNYKLYSIVKDDVEGYSEMLSGSEFFLYPSIREDINVSMIARATTGAMGFEFLTGEVPKDHPKGDITFAMLSDVDLNLSESFDVFINDQHLLTFNSKEDGSLEISQNPGKGNIEYLLVRRDGNGDGIGLLRLRVPDATVKKGEKAKIRIVGHKKNSNCWIMIFKATDTVERIKKSAFTEVAFEISQSGKMLYLDAPAHFTGREIFVVSDGKKSKVKKLSSQGELSKASFKLDPPKNSFKIVVEGEELTVDFKKGDGTVTLTDIKGNYLYHHVATMTDHWKASMNKLFRPEFFDTFNDFFDRRYEKGLVSIMNSSHQDIAWVDRPEVCIILRDTLLLRPVLKDAFVRDDYGFDIEDGLMLREYIDRHPESVEALSTLLNKKLISVGATYNCPYEDMYDAEDQVRQLYLGKKWAKNTFGGYDSKVYWNVDVPGKSLQTPQILKKAGVDYMVISRHAKGMFHWASPDGSSVFTYSPGHYGNDLLYLSRDLNNKMKYGAEQVLYWESSFEDGKIHTPLLSSQDMLPAIDYSDFISNWNSFESMKDEQGEKKDVHLPPMELMTMDEYLPLAEKYATKVDTIMGERPNVWVYIHGPGHHDALSASREASKLLPAAEKFLAIADQLDPERMPYPFEEFDKAWQAKIYPDHGWGGHDGDITDNLFKENLVASKTMGDKLLDKGLNFLSARVKTNSKLGIPVVLFNSLSWERSDPVTIKMNFVQGNMKQIRLQDADKNEINHQLSNQLFYDDGSIQSTDITFIAVNVPSIGYKTYYVSNGKQDHPKRSQQSVNTYENNFYKISFSSGGIESVTDKEFGRKLFSTKGLKVGDVFTTESVGNGAGEFGDVQQPSMNDFDLVSAHDGAWKVVEDGNVFTKYQLEQQILHAKVIMEVTVFHDLKRIYFDTGLHNWTGELYREFRTAFPINMESPEVAHEVPFGSVRVGKDEIKTAGERYTPLCKDVHPRAIIDWISASDDTMSVTLSSSVAAADWVDPTGKSESGVVLQNLLLASRTSCHWEGNEYSQAGSHQFNTVLTSTKSGSWSGRKVAKQKNEPLYAVIYPETSSKAFLPETLSFFSVDSDNIIMTTVKKAEDRKGLITRLYNVGEQQENITFSSYFDVDSFFKTNIIEEDPQPIGKELEVGKYSIETIKLDLENSK